MTEPSKQSEQNPAWPKGVYNCCQGSDGCANNRTKKIVDYFADLFASNSEKARIELWEATANREEESEMRGYRIKELEAERSALKKVVGELVKALQQIQQDYPCGRGIPCASCTAGKALAVAQAWVKEESGQLKDKVGE